MINRLIKFLRFPIRLMIIPPVLISVLSEYVTAGGLAFAMFTGLGAVILGELLGHTRLRQRTLLGMALACLAFGGVLAFSMSQFTLFASIFGASKTIALRSILFTGIGVFGLLAGLRALAIKSNVWFSIELMILVFGCGYAFAPHRDGQIMQPLWLSDWAWKQGLEPTLLLGVLGSVLICILALLAILDRARRIPVSILLLPILVLLALISLDPKSLWFDVPPPSGIDGLRDDLGQPPPPQGARGGSSDPNDQPGQGMSGESEGEREREQAYSGQGEGGGSGQSTPVAVVLFQNDYEPLNEYYYFRQDAHSFYSGLRMNRSSKTQIPDGNVRSFPTTETQVSPVPPSMYRRPVDTEIFLLTPHNLPFALESVVQFRPIPNPRPARFARVYGAASLSVDIDYAMMLDLPVGDTDWPQPVWDHYTQAPEDPRYKALSDDIVSRLPDEYQDLPFAKAVALKLYLDENMKYTQRVKHDGVPDPTADFLFGEEDQLIGYCVHSAAALTYLMRTQGIPSRIGLGYATSAESRSGSAVMISDSDAHTWPEIYVQDVGWVVLDVSPAENLDQAGEPINKEMLDALAELARADADSEFREPIDWAALWATAKPILILGGSLLLIVLMVGHYLVKIVRVIRPIWTTGSDHARVSLISALDRLSAVGVIRLKGESREAFAQRLAAHYPTLQHITSAQLRCTFSIEPDHELSLNQEIKHLQRAIAQNVVWWKHLLGWINPISFYRTR